MKVEEYIEKIKKIDKAEELQKLTHGFFQAMRDGTLTVVKKPPHGYKWNGRGLLVDSAGNIIQPPVCERDPVACEYSNEEYLGECK